MNTKTIYITRSADDSDISRDLHGPDCIWVCAGELEHGDVPGGLIDVVVQAESLRRLAYEALRTEPRAERGLLADMASCQGAGLLMPVEAMELRARLVDGGDPGRMQDWQLLAGGRGDWTKITDVLIAIGERQRAA